MLDLCWLCPSPGLLGGLFLLGLLYYWYMTRTYDTFVKMGVQGPKPSIWKLGNFLDFTEDGTLEHNIKLKEKYGGVVGSFSGPRPVLRIMDPRFLREILIKDFDSFNNRYVLKMNKLGLSKLLTQIDGEEWKHVRTQLTPAFSSRRLRQVVQHVNRSAKHMVTNLEKNADSGETIDIRHRVRSFVMDAIAGFGFGVDIDSLNDPTNEFIKHASAGAAQISVKGFGILLFVIFPFVVKLLMKIGLSPFPLKGLQFFSDLTGKILKQRKEDKNLSQPDTFIQMMVDTQEEDHTQNMDANDNSGEFMRTMKSTKKSLTHEEILGAGLMFFMAGNDTTASTLNFLCYNLACHPEIQQRVMDEVDEVMEGQENPTYDLVSKMKYLEMCIEETLRMFPPVLRIDRMCNKSTNVHGIDIPKGMMIFIPIYAIHHDPEIYPEPNKFIPERFTTEEKALRSPYAWLPFGGGPRMCIGQRLAVIQMKLAMVHLIRRYRLLTCDETVNPMRLSEEFLFAVPKEKILLKVEKR